MKKIFFTLLLSLCLFFILELVSYNFLYGYLRKMNHPIMPNVEISTNYKLFKIPPPDILSFDIDLGERNDETLIFDNRKQPILTVGCSYTYGEGLDTNQTFASQLTKKTNRKVVNIGMQGSGSGLVLRKLAYMEKSNQLNTEFKYVIYTLMYDNVNRIHDLGLLSCYISGILEQNKNNSLKDKIKCYLNKSYTFKLLYAKKYTDEMGFEGRFNYLKYNISKMNEIIKRTIPDCQFVVLLYDDITNASKDFVNIEESPISLDKNNYPELTAKGVKFISTKDLVGDILWKEEYQIEYDTSQYWRPHHPGEKAWEMIVPQLCKELNL